MQQRSKAVYENESEGFLCCWHMLKLLSLLCRRAATLANADRKTSISLVNPQGTRSSYETHCGSICQTGL